MYSLRRRLLISATLVLLVFLGLMSAGLSKAFEQSVLSNAEDALRNQVLLLIANIDVDGDKIVVPPFLPEARLTQPDSSLFAQIQIDGKGVVWKSRSLLENTLPELDSTLGNFEFYQSVDWPNKPEIYSTTLGVEWETDEGELAFTVQLAEHAAAYKTRLARYKRQVAVWLLVLASCLLILLLMLLGWALNPLKRVTRQVGEIEEGSRQRFDEDYPLEVSRLTQNLNQLISSEEQRIGRQKEVLGNLAHSLKTPIAVLTGLKYQSDNEAEVRTQLSSMQNIIDYQLQSASAVGRRRFAKPILVAKPVQQIVSSLSKLHQDKGLQVTVSLDQDLQFFGDQGDWMELAGNLVDNAFKWANQTVSITASKVPLDDGQSHRSGVYLVVEDDGPGINEELKQTILQRGVRLDSQTPGHGLGLHIVKGIVEAYNGDVEITDGENAGTRFCITLR